MDIDRHLTISLAAAVMFGSFLAEVVLSRVVRRDDHLDLRDTAVNLVIGGGYVVSTLLLGLFVGGVLLAVWSLSPVRWDMRSPWHWVVLLLCEDFLYYWSHRASHQVPFMWASHVVHHNSPKLNLSTGMRNSWVGGYFDWVFFVPLAALGFHPLAIGVVQAVGTTWDFLTHSPYLPSHPLLDFFFNSPSNHRVHHSKSPEHADKNLGGLLIIWDRMFGTYQREGAPAGYGTSPMPRRPYSPLHLEFYLWKDLLGRLVRGRRAHARTSTGAT
jgi:sterol desaturase/sphingolipid hydroxylase (fatty acid hydroxylase superfamily)